MLVSGSAPYRFGGARPARPLRHTSCTKLPGRGRAPPMTETRSLLIAGVLLMACVLGASTPLQAQGIEITPFGGYRFGGDFFELITGRPVDTDGAPAIGATIDIPLHDGLQIEGLFT